MDLLVGVSRQVRYENLYEIKVYDLYCALRGETPSRIYVYHGDATLMSNFHDQVNVIYRWDSKGGHAEMCTEYIPQRNVHDTYTANV